MDVGAVYLPQGNRGGRESRVYASRALEQQVTKGGPPDDNSA